MYQRYSVFASLQLMTSLAQATTACSGVVRICSDRYEGPRSLMQPRIAFASLTFLPPWPVLSLVLPASSFARAPWLARRAPEIGD
jgi:hypothetical protein